jgi:DNA-binding IclR family transcriptional regulator
MPGASPGSGSARWRTNSAAGTRESGTVTPQVKLNQSVQRAAALVRAAAARPTGETASGLARAAGLPNATALRLIHTLEREGFLMRLPADGRYVIGLDLVRLGRDVDTADVLLAVARDALERVAAETRETVTLSVLRGPESFDIVLQIDAPHLIQAVNWVGHRYPLHATSSGKIVLAALDPERLDRVLSAPLERLTSATITDPEALRRELERVREQRHSVIVDELEEGLASVSVPILAGPGVLLGSVNVTGPTFRFDADRRARAIEFLHGVADEIGRTLRNVVSGDGAAGPHG